MVRNTLKWLTALSLTGFLSCGSEVTEPKLTDPNVVSSVTVQGATQLTALGATVQLTASAMNAGGGSVAGKSFTWSSSNTMVASVDGTGLVTAIANGNTTITATTDGVSGTVALSIQQTVTDVVVSPESATLAVGDHILLTASGTDAFGNDVTGASYEWSSNAANVATVTSDGEVTAVGDGNAVITARASLGQAAASANITVSSGPVLQVNVSSFQLSNNTTRGLLVISNSGSDMLQWSISGAPSWLSFSNISGVTTAELDSVIVQADLSVAVGTYAGTFSVNASGQSRTVNVSFDVMAPIEVIPGAAAGGVSLFARYGAISALHGEAESGALALICIGNSCAWYHERSYASKGLTFVFLTGSPNLSILDSTLIVGMDQPYKGVTDLGIGLASTLAALVNAYGPPEVIDASGNDYEYASLGIDFGYDITETFVQDMVVYPASSPTPPSSAVVASPSIADALVRNYAEVRQSARQSNGVRIELGILRR